MTILFFILRITFISLNLDEVVLIKIPVKFNYIFIARQQIKLN